MPALKKVTRNRRIRLRNGKTFSLRARPEAAAAVYFGVLFRNGSTVFMPRRAGKPDRDLEEIRVHALAVRGLSEEHAGDIAVVAEACGKCAREIPGCPGCDFSRARAVEQQKAEEHNAESH